MTMSKRIAARMNAGPMIRGVFIIAVVLFSGCTAMGPQTIDRDRFDYVSAISESLKRQTLLNLLKTRYQDVPVFLDIASVINQYAMERQLGLGVEGEFYNRGDPSFIGPSFSAGGRFEDRPTITYNPLMGPDFARSVMSPIPLPAILTLIQSGYPADYVFRVCVQTIQGLENSRSGPIGAREADPEFHELLRLFREAADKGAIAFRTRMFQDKSKTVIVFRPPAGPKAGGRLDEVARILGLNPTVKEFTIVQGRIAENDREVAVFSRSLIQVMIEYASFIDVPESDIVEGRVYAVQHKPPANDHVLPPLINVCSGNSEPDNAYVAVPYRDCWFWIDDRDLHSKALFSFLVVLNSFTERGDGTSAVPVISVPTN
jgi:hypothetical protein